MIDDQERLLQRRAAELVYREVGCCMSGIVSTLAQGYGGAITPHAIGELELAELCEQAATLAAPVLDYESAAREAGWNNGPDAWSNLPNDEGYWGKDGAAEPAGNVVAYETAQEVCDAESIEPHELEVYEHWSVSPWLADKLTAKGERVDTDFGGLCIWARTCTGQAISLDAVIRDIARELHVGAREG